jgi:two-component system, OmpR family, response regulator
MAGGRCRILVVEDDRETADQLKDSLAASGYHVDLAVDGREGLSRGRSAEYAVMTVDRMLPDIDGLAVIRRLREDGIVTPALIVSALGEIDDRVRGLRAGGDDYLVKPFAVAELLARVDALARRSDTVVKETLLRVGDLTLDLVSRTVTRSGPPFRPDDQHHRRLCRACPSQSRRPPGLSADPYRPRYRVLCPCSWLRPYGHPRFDWP